MSKGLLFLVVALTSGLTMALVHAVDEQQAAHPPAREIPGITVEDPYPHGCVDCHINYADMNMDTRFSTLMKTWHVSVEAKLLDKARASAPKNMKLKGMHPSAESALEDIPAGCMACHGRESEIAPAFSNMLHVIHLTGGEENHFLTLFQGECTYCHKLDLATGRWAIPSFPER